MVMKKLIPIFCVLYILAALTLNSFAVNKVLAQNATYVHPGANNNNVAAKNEVSIVEGASDLGDKAYRPSLIKIKVGDSITWTNNDSITPHTVTEGNPANNVPTSGFNSGLLSQGQTFKHKFDKAGAIEYFCTLHPTMIGKVVVNS
jgi:plastocyanin